MLGLIKKNPFHDITVMEGIFVCMGILRLLLVITVRRTCIPSIEGAWGDYTIGSEIPLIFW